MASIEEDASRAEEVPDEDELPEHLVVLQHPDHDNQIKTNLAEQGRLVISRNVLKE